ncbi:hypothetical protein MXD62_13155 [Frankia sp. Mgl5]|uniref:recombination directionality factor n=1 Tax=Frankia sp. Mgl5 TaxID=2933793 RepID=UPI00200CC95A|nr:hypothetical protein [Frankia sp. Mgl5]MCK9928109.1 hypothetical protein [Frankia sp. Mgl5]
MPITVPSILDAQRSGVEDGRIRPGTSKPSTNPNAKPGTRVPVRLQKWRLTSSNQKAIEAVATRFGGTPQPWAESRRGTQWEVITETNRLPIFIPPAVALDQWMELWSGGKCLRRCEGGPGAVNTRNRRPCECPSDDAERIALAKQNPPAACKTMSRFRVRLLDVPGIGFWRVECGGFHGAVEMKATVDTLAALAGQGRHVAAFLRLDWRTEPGKQYVVPTIEVPETERQILAQTATLNEIAAGHSSLGMPTARPQITAGPATAPIPAPAAPPPADSADPEQVTAQVRQIAAELRAVALTDRDAGTRIRAIGNEAHRRGLLDEYIPDTDPATTVRDTVLDLIAAVAAGHKDGSE